MGKNRLAGLSTEAWTVCGIGSDGSRPGTGAVPPLHTSGQSARVFFSVKNPRTRPGRDPVEGKSSKGLLWVGRPPGAPLIGISTIKKTKQQEQQMKHGSHSLKSLNTNDHLSYLLDLERLEALNVSWNGLVALVLNVYE
jgi:hypothetical protein